MKKINAENLKDHAIVYDLTSKEKEIYAMRKDDFKEFETLRQESRSSGYNIPEDALFELKVFRWLYNCYCISEERVTFKANSLGIEPIFTEVEYGEDFIEIP